MQNKNYRLLKDLPFAKAGEIFESRILDDGKECMFWGKIKIQNIKNFAEWFEEVKKSKRKYLIDFYQAKVNETLEEFYMDWADNNLTDLMVWFDTREEAEKYLAYLKAKAIIKEDTKGFKPNWDTNKEVKNIEPKYIGSYGGLPEKPTLNWNVIYTYTYSTICFRTLEDIMDSFKKHPNEWRTYLTYEQ